MKKTVVFDFDGVIHSYSSGWKGTTNIPDPPVPGIENALKEIHNAGYEVVIVSTRCSTAFGRLAIESWLDMYDLSMYVDIVCKEKPPAIVYIDDRAICFDGHPENLLGKIKAFKPWNKAPATNADRIRAMSDEELAEFLWDFDLAAVSTVKMGEFGPHMFRYRLKEWLQQPAEELLTDEQADGGDD